MSQRTRPIAIALSVGVFAASVALGNGGPSRSGPLAPANPSMGPQGTSTMHADSGSSDSTPFVPDPATPWQGQPASLLLTLPPLSVLVLVPPGTCTEP